MEKKSNETINQKIFFKNKTNFLKLFYKNLRNIENFLFQIKKFFLLE